MEANMKTFRVPFFAATMALALSAGIAKAEVGVGVSADNDGVKSFHMSIGEHFRVPEKEIIVVREQKIPDDELPVVFFIAQRAKVEPGAIVKLRTGGKSWMDITHHYGLSPSIYYVAFDNDPGPPYGKAWGYYKKHKKEEWKTIRLADADIVNSVNVKFMSDRYGYSPEQVIKMRTKGESFVYVNSNIKKHKQSKNAEADNSSKDKSGKGKGKKK